MSEAGHRIGAAREAQAIPGQGLVAADDGDAGLVLDGLNRARGAHRRARGENRVGARLRQFQCRRAHGYGRGARDIGIAQTPKAITGGTRFGTKEISPRRTLFNAIINDAEISRNAARVPVSIPSMLRLAI